MRNFRLLIIASLVFIGSTAFSNEAEDPKKEKTWYEKGSLYGKIYANFHTSGSEAGKQNAFEVNRAYFGYKTTLDNHFAANIKLDIGASEDLGKRFAFFKNAYLQYKYDKFKVQFGIADAFQFKTQEKFWGYRYIYKSFQDEYRFGSSADIGIFMNYTFTDWLAVDYSINNGDGYGKIQNTSTDNLKNTLGITINPIKILTLRAYGDVMSLSSDSTQATAVFFAGLTYKPFSVGGEYVFQSNNKLILDHDYSGMSVFATYKIIDNLKVFARYDHLSSVELNDSTGTGATEAWNLSNDGDFIIGGIEYSPINKVSLALNYRHGISADESKGDTSWLYINLRVTF